MFARRGWDYIYDPQTHKENATPGTHAVWQAVRDEANQWRDTGLVTQNFDCGGGSIVALAFLVLQTCLKFRFRKKL